MCNHVGRDGGTPIVLEGLKKTRQDWGDGVGSGRAQCSGIWLSSLEEEHEYQGCSMMGIQKRLEQQSILRWPRG